MDSKNNINNLKDLKKIVDELYSTNGNMDLENVDLEFNSKKLYISESY